jgi:arylsulfatase A-like enzyme
VRVPFVMSWPGTIPAGRVDNRPVISLDVFATALGVAGVPMPKDRVYDSVDLVPYLTGAKAGPPHERLFWRSAKLLAVREGRWKLVRGTGPRDELYDLTNDVAESRDLAAAEPAVVARLAQALDAWNSELIAPVFPGLGADRGAKQAKQNKQKKL